MAKRETDRVVLALEIERDMMIALDAHAENLGVPRSVYVRRILDKTLKAASVQGFSPYGRKMGRMKESERPKTVLKPKAQTPTGKTYNLSPDECLHPRVLVQHGICQGCGEPRLTGT